MIAELKIFIFEPFQQVTVAPSARVVPKRHFAAIIGEFVREAVDDVLANDVKGVEQVLKVWTVSGVSVKICACS